MGQEMRGSRVIASLDARVLGGLLTSIVAIATTPVHSAYSASVDVIYSFSPLEGTSPSTGYPRNLDGFYGGPPTDLVLGSDGSLYGATDLGGAYGQGTIFKVSPAGQFATLHSFSNDSRAALKGLIQLSNGTFFGVSTGSTNVASGMGRNGYYFTLSAGGTWRGSPDSFHGGANGYHPLAGLTEGIDGNVYGVTRHGGTQGRGTAFRITVPNPCPLQPGPCTSITTLHSFGVTDSYPTGLVRGSDDDFYGAASNGVFKLTQDGTFIALHYFSDEGYIHPPVLARDGNLYGATQRSFYKITADGTFILVGTFDQDAFFSARLTEGSDGAFYAPIRNADFSGFKVLRLQSNGEAIVISPSPAAPFLNVSRLVEGESGVFYAAEVNKSTASGDPDDPGKIIKVTIRGTGDENPNTGDTTEETEEAAGDSPANGSTSSDANGGGGALNLALLLFLIGASILRQSKTVFSR